MIPFIRSGPAASGEQATLNVFTRAAQTGNPAATSGSTAAFPSYNALKVVRYGSLAVLGGYTVALCYRAGLFSRLLPSHVNAKLERTVERVMARTQPVGNIKRFAMARNHLMRTYGWASSGMVVFIAGVGFFCLCPTLPIALPVAATAFSAVLVGGLPKTLMIPAARVVSFYVACVSAGYCLGPIGYAAQDTLLVFLMLTGCTMTGLCVPLFLTRGMVSYVASAHLLSLALSLSLVTAPKTTPTWSPFAVLKAHPGVQVILNGDVNVLLTMQMITSVGISVLHTLPTIYYYVTSAESDEVVGVSVDPLQEAFCICSGWVYVQYCLVRRLTKMMIRRILAENTRNAHSGSEGSWTLSAGGDRGGRSSDHFGSINIASSVTAGLVSLLWYVRAISFLQKGDLEAMLHRLRVLCARLSPIGMLLHSGSSVEHA